MPASAAAVLNAVVNVFLNQLRLLGLDGVIAISVGKSSW